MGNGKEGQVVEGEAEVAYSEWCWVDTQPSGSVEHLAQ